MGLFTRFLKRQDSDQYRIKQSMEDHLVYGHVGIIEEAYNKFLKS